MPSALATCGAFLILRANTAAQPLFLLYLVFLVVLGLPVMVMEFAVGRASQKSCAKSFETLASGHEMASFQMVGLLEAVTF